MKKRTRWWLLAGGVLAALVLLWWKLADSGVEVATAQVGRQALQVTVREQGRTRLRERYVVAAPVAGRLARIELKAGDAVATGELVTRIHPLPEGAREVGVAGARLRAAQAYRRQAAARLEEAQVQRLQRQREAARGRDLAADGIVSPERVEQEEAAAATARQQVDAARASLRAAEADVAAARAALVGADPESAGESVAVRAPSGGRLLRVLEESERVVQAGTPLVEIGEAARLEAVVDVLSEDAVRIAAGAPVRLEQWGGDRPLHGRVERVEPDAFTKVSALGVEEQRVNVIVELDEAPPALGSGYRVEAAIVTWQGQQVLTVPTSALFQAQDGWAVFVVEQGRAAQRPVRIGHRSAEAAEVVEGLAEGTEVILFPSAEIAPGVKVRAGG